MTLLPCFSRSRVALLSVCAAGLLVLPASASHVRRGPTSPRSHASVKRTHAGAGQSHHSRGSRHGVASRAASSSRPRAIDDARATEIQDALVKAGYLQTASGHWDEASADAMRKMQAENGWQTKLIPDSRALIKLGLGANGGGAAETSVNAVTPTE